MISQETILKNKLKYLEIVCAVEGGYRFRLENGVFTTWAILDLKELVELSLSPVSKHKVFLLRRKFTYLSLSLCRFVYPNISVFSPSRMILIAVSDIYSRMIVLKFSYTYSNNDTVERRVLFRLWRRNSVDEITNSHFNN